MIGRIYTKENGEIHIGVPIDADITRNELDALLLACEIKKLLPTIQDRFFSEARKITSAEFKRFLDVLQDVVRKTADTPTP